MKTGQNTISSFQLFSMIYIFRMVATFTYMLRIRAPLESTDRAIMAIAYFVFSLLFALPVFLCIGKQPYNSVLTLAGTNRHKWTKPVAMYYAFTFIWAAGVAAARFSLFSGIVLLQQENLNIFIFVLLAVSVYCASKGLEPLARAGSVMSVLLFVSLILMTGTVIKDFDTLYLQPPLQSGLSAVIYQGFHSACRNIETTSLLFTASHTKGNLRKGYLIWLVFFCVQLAALFLLVGGIAAEYGNLQMFPLYTLAALAKIGILERMDDLLTGVWVICALLKIAYLLHTSVAAIGEGFQNKYNRNKLLIAGGILVFAANLFLSQNIEFFGKFIASPVNPVLFMIATVVLPLLIFAKNRTKKTAVRGKI